MNYRQAVKKPNTANALYLFKYGTWRHKINDDVFHTTQGINHTT